MKAIRTIGAVVALSGLSGLSALSTVAASASTQGPTLAGRAVLPADSLAPGPPSGAAFATANGISFPRPSQPVAGFSAIVAGRAPGEFLAMPDNGFGAKSNSRDFLIRAYYIRPDFKTARGGTGAQPGHRRRQRADRDQGARPPVLSRPTASRGGCRTTTARRGFARMGITRSRRG